jgi:hypothetical protein
VGECRESMTALGAGIRTKYCNDVMKHAYEAFLGALLPKW